MSKFHITSSCTGCYESEEGHPIGEYPYDKKAGCYIGAGCHECGYTGKRRNYYDTKDFEPGGHFFPELMPLQEGEMIFLT